MKNWLLPIGLLFSISLSAQVGLQVVNDGIIEKTLTIGQTTVGDSTLNILGGISLTGGLSIGDLTTNNIFVGNTAGEANTSGSSNTAVGVQSLKVNTTGNNNTAVGALSLNSNIDGGNNTALGFTAMNVNSSGNGNTAVGSSSLKANDMGGNNVAVGLQALEKATSASNNVALGALSLNSTQTAGDNVGIGFSALASHTSGTQNVAVGHTSMNANTQGFSNTAIGGSSLNQNTIGDENVAVGMLALSGVGNDEGNKNTAVGFNAFNNNDAGATTYNNSTAVGANTVIAGQNSTAIGANAETTQDNEIRLGNDDVTTIGGAVDFTVTSDKRVKQRIKKDVPGLDFINLLQPVTYQMDMNTLYELRGTPASARNASAKANIRYTGFLAQDVESAAQEVNYDFSGVDTPAKEGGLYGLRYASFVAPLVQAVQELSTENEQLQIEKETQAETISDLENRMTQLEAMLQQLVNNETETRNTATQIVTLSEAKLAQNEPNPFSDFTTIPYFLPDFIQRATLEITNANGQMIKTVTITNRGQGQVVLETKTLGNGTYFYTLIMDEVRQETKQMVLQK